MLQIALVVILAILWLLTLTRIGGTDFIRVTAFQFGGTSLKVLDVIVGMVIIGIISTMRGPLAWTGVALLILWVLTLLGIPQVQGVAVEPLILFVILIGTSVHIVTHRRR